MDIVVVLQANIPPGSQTLTMPWICYPTILSIAWGNISLVQMLMFFCSCFSSLLASVHWPQTNPATTEQLDSWNTHITNFSLLFTNLMKLDDRAPSSGRTTQHSPPNDRALMSSDDGRVSDDRRISTVSTDGGVHPLRSFAEALLLPLELMVQPLRKRFRYHFMEERRTNSLEKVNRHPWFMVHADSMYY